MRRLIPLVLPLILLAGCEAEDPNPPPPNGPVVHDPLKAGPQGSEGSLRQIGEPNAPASVPAAKVSEKETPAFLVASGIKAEDSDDPAAADRFYDRALNADPKDRDALFHSAKVAQLIGAALPRPHSNRIILKGAEAARALRANFPNLTDDEKAVVAVSFYNEACTRAQNGELSRVVPILAEAYAAGFADLSQIDLDGELDPVRKDPEFHRLLDRMEREEMARRLAANQPFPFTFQLEDFEKKSGALADYQGKVLLVDFWGSWCAPCRKELPHLIALRKKYLDRGFEIVGLNYENELNDSTREFFQKLLKQHGITYRCLVGDDKTQKQVPRFSGFPTTLLLDRTGTVRLHLTGYQPLGALEAAVVALLGEPDTKPTTEKAKASEPAEKKPATATTPK